jgi:hypothetical protein
MGERILGSSRKKSVCVAGECVKNCFKNTAETKVVDYPAPEGTNLINVGASSKLIQYFVFSDRRMTICATILLLCLSGCCGEYLLWHKADPHRITFVG